MLTALGVISLPELFVQWNRFEQIDAFQTADVACYLDDRWYPGANDIDLFDTRAI